MRLGDGRTVRLGDVERELRRAWESLDEESCRIDGESVLRLRELNLVVLTDMEGAEWARSIAARSTLDHPARVILVVSGSAGPMVSTTIGCIVDPRSGREVCGEEIVLESVPGQEEMIRSAVVRLLVPDLPVALWWSVDPLSYPSELRVLSEAVEELVIDLAVASDLEGALAGLSGMLKDDSGLDLRELEWLRIAPWRELVAESFERPDRRHLAGRIERVEVTHANAPAQALLLVGWVASRLRCAVGSRGWGASKESLTLSLTRLGRPTLPAGLEICISEARAGEEGLIRGLLEVKIRMQGTLVREESGGEEGSVRVVVISRLGGSVVCTCGAEEGADESVIKSAGAAGEDYGRLLSLAVTSSGRDRSLEASLDVASKLAEAPGSVWGARGPSSGDATGADAP